jgi:hypothetical protein
MPTPSNASNPLLAAFAPWLAALPSSDAQSGIAGIAGPAWAPSLESQARLWAPWIEAQRNFWSMYTSFFQSVPAFLNGGGKTVAEDDAGLEPAETADGIPDALEMQMRTWNHFLDANRSFWTAISWPGTGEAESANEASQSETAAVAPARAAPRKKPRAKR